MNGPFFGIVLFADFHVGAAALGGPPKHNGSLGFGPPRGGGPYRIKYALGRFLFSFRVEIAGKLVYNQLKRRMQK